MHAVPADRRHSIQAGHAGPCATLIASRLTSETILRGVDLLGDLAEGNLAHGMVVSALWCLRLSEGIASPTFQIVPKLCHESGSIRGLARALEMPFPTVHRHLTVLARRGMAVRSPVGRFTISPGLIDGRSGQEYRNRSLASARRFIVGLYRMGRVSGDITAFKRDRGLSIAQQDAVFRAHMEIVLANLRLMTCMYGDLMTGLVYNFVAAANVEHLTDVSAVLPDDMRRPISVYRVAKSLHIPYETARRITRRLLDRSVFEQVGHRGVIVPERLLRASIDSAIAMERDRSVAGGLRQIHLAGVPIRFCTEH